MKTKVLFLLSLFFVSNVVFAVECTKDELKEVVSNDAETIACKKFQQPTDAATYISLLEVFPEDGEDLRGATISHFVKSKGSKVRLLFQKSNLGSHFMEFESKNKSYLLLIHDVNGDGKLDVAFRVSYFPATALFIQSFSQTSEKIFHFGRFQTYEGNPEFYPENVFEYEDKVEIDGKFINVKSANGKKLVYQMLKNAYFLKSEE